MTYLLIYIFFNKAWPMISEGTIVYLELESRTHRTIKRLLICAWQERMYS